MITFKILSFCLSYTKTFQNQPIDIKTLLPSGTNRKIGSQFYIDGKKYRLLKTLHSRDSERAIFKLQEISSQIMPSKLTNNSIVGITFSRFRSNYVSS